MTQHQKINRFLFAKQLKGNKSKIRNLLIMNHTIYRKNEDYTIKIFLNKFGLICCALKALFFLLLVIVAIIPYTLWVGLKEIVDDPLGFLQSFNYLTYFQDCKKGIEYEIYVKKEFVPGLKKDLNLLEDKWEKYFE